MKRLTLLCISLLLLLSLASCNNKHNQVKESAQSVADAFTNNDMNSINLAIFGTDGVKVDENLYEIWGENSQKQAGILSGVFENVTVKIIKINDTTIEYEVSAPDLRNLFVSLNTDTENLTEDDLREFIKEYVHNADTMISTVTLEYSITDNGVQINYQDENFINAVTGGLLEAYHVLYSDLLEGYSTEENE